MNNKTNIIIFILLFLHVNIYSQKTNTSKGRFMIGGTVSGNYHINKSELSNGDYRTSRIFETFIGPNFGFFILNEFVIGSEVSYEAKFIDNQNSNDWDNLHSVYFTPYLRYYFLTHLFLNSKFGLGFNKETYYNTGSNNQKYIYDDFRYKIECGIGYSLFVNENTSVDFILQYYHYNSKPYEQKFIESGLRFDIALQVYL